MIDRRSSLANRALMRSRCYHQRYVRGLSNHENRRLSRSRTRSARCSASGRTRGRLGERRHGRGGRAADAGADAFLGKITPAMLARADRLVWVQSFTASLEHYMFPELLAHPCVLTNMRGLFDHVIADQVMGYVLCFARNLHTYMRHQIEQRYEPVGGESARVSSLTGPATVNAMDRATIYLPDATLGIVGMGAIGCDIARRALAFGMSVRGVDRFPERVRPPEGVQSVAGIDKLPELLAWSDFAVIAAPQTPETAGLFDAGTLAHLRPSSYLINIGRGAIVVLDDLVAALRAGRLAGARSTSTRSSRCPPTIRSGISPT